MKKTKILLLTFLCFFLFNSCTKIGEKGRLFLRFINDNTFKYVEDKIRINPDGDNKNPIINGDYIEIKSISSFNYVVDYIGSNISSYSCGRDFDAINPNNGTSGKNGENKYIDVDLKPVLESLEGTQYFHFVDKSIISTSNKSTYQTNVGGNAGYNCVSGNCVSVNSNAQYPTLSDCQNQCNNAGTTELVNTGITGQIQERKYVEFVVPANVKFMDVRTKETPPNEYNNADLFVRKGSKPITNDNTTSYTADCASKNVNRQQDFCQFNNPQPGTWWVMLYNWNGNHYESNLVITITK